MAHTTPVARYCRKPGRQPTGPHLSLRLTLCQHSGIHPPNEGIKALYMSRIIHFHKNKTYLHNRFRRGRIDSKNRRGRNKLRVAANGASIEALDQKLSRSEVADEYWRIGTELILNQFSGPILSIHFS
ncbi:hypothetical protein PIB30_053307 [Stylosanthes scabra]|uniref:Uncharacterized protein n=1 Tax=Stylosanthes scabra TaxID=79078 RepID=A0ABU6XG77_9FABA|nr:hypothetical protein [Stylosanthes scabra]